MDPELKHISVCICTFLRAKLLERLLERLKQQQTGNRFVFRIVVADNDSRQSAQRVVEEFAATGGIDVTYTCEPRQNIALARNRALTHATGDFVALIDDDEFPENNWLAAMLEACEKYGATGVQRGDSVRSRADRALPAELHAQTRDAAREKQLEASGWTGWTGNSIDHCGADLFGDAPVHACPRTARFHEVLH